MQAASHQELLRRKAELESRNAELEQENALLKAEVAELQERLTEVERRLAKLLTQTRSENGLYGSNEAVLVRPSQPHQPPTPLARSEALPQAKEQKRTQARGSERSQRPHSRIRE